MEIGLYLAGKLEIMTQDDFLKECAKHGVDSITETENKDYENGFKVNLKTGDAIYVLFRDEYGDQWTDYKWAKKYHDEWANTRILSPEEQKEFWQRTYQTMVDRYAPENFEKLLDITKMNKNEV